MQQPKTVVEGERYSLSDLKLDSADPRELLALSKFISKKNRKLQVELGLRAKPIQLDIAAEPTITIYGVAGTLALGSIRLDVAPKYLALDLDTGGTDWQRALVVMLEVSSRGKVTFASAPSFGATELSFIDRLSFAFASELRAARQGARIRQYRPLEEQGRVLRGRLRVTEQMRLVLTRPDLVAYERDHLDTDNDPNRLLRWAAQRLLTVTRHAHTRRFLQAEMTELPQTRNVRPSRVDFKVPRQFTHYQGALDLAGTVVRNQGILRGLTAFSGADFLVGTEKLFESFLENRLAEIASSVTDWGIEAQASVKFAHSQSGLKNYYSRPDDVLSIAGVQSLVIDAKYKKFSDQAGSNAKKPTNADLYQMVAACVAHKTTCALLVYPKMKPLAPSEIPADDVDVPVDDIAWWTVDLADRKSIEVGAARVDVSGLQLASDLITFDRRLFSLIKSAITEKVPHDQPTSRD